jgi:CDP-diacylglycerol--serine O-phosphatidyltransferase
MKKNRWITIADILTFMSLISGVLSMFFSLKSMFVEAALFMIFAVFFDFADGRVARLLKQESELGAQLDSLSDLVSFGAAPAVFFLSMFSVNIVELLIAIIFVCCGAYRLARFNIQKDKKGFYGMPITMNGLLFPALFLLASGKYVYIVLLAVSALLMISTFKIKKL